MRRAGLSAVAILLVLGLGGFASAKLKEKSTTFTVPGEATGEGSAKCKKGQEAVSGGFFDPIEFGVDFRLVLPFDSARAGKRKWRHRAINVTTDDDEATVYAYCDPAKRELKVRSTTETSDEFEIFATARCPRGQEAVSGGFESSASEDGAVIPLASKRVGKRKWESRALNETSGNADLTSFAYCDKSEPGLKTKQATATVESPNTSTVTAQCRRGRRVVSGGFDAEFSLTDLIIPFINGSRRGGKREWEVTAAVGMSNPAEITAYAYCEKKPRR
jgi:hypothetical protein